MKKQTIFAAVALAAVVLTGCGKKGADKFDDVKLSNKTTQADSVSYLIGEQMALDRVNRAEQDTLLKSSEAREKYDEGFYAGLEALTGKNKAFNAGFAEGVMVASQLLAQGEQMGENFSIDALASGYSHSFDKNGKPIKDLKERAERNQGKLMAMMQQLQGKAQLKAAEEAIKKTAPARKALPAKAKELGYQDLKGFYVKTVNAGNGSKLKAGDNIMASVGLSDTEGNVIFPANPIPQTVGTGSTYSPALDAVQTQLEMNGKYLIIGTVDQLLAKEMAAQAIISQQLDPTKLYIIEYEVAPAAEIGTAPVSTPGM